jgi:hypothetical protein
MVYVKSVLAGVAALLVASVLYFSWIRRIWASRVAAKSCVDRRRVHVVEFHRFLTIG